MQAYGRKKSATHVAHHQECGVCHPVQKNKSKRARQQVKKEIAMSNKPMMKCGHAANATNGEGKPSCVICIGLTNDAKTADELFCVEDLVGRKARCSYYGSTPRGRNHESNYGCKYGEECLCEVPSDTSLPFFSWTPMNDFDDFYCGCWGWD